MPEWGAWLGIDTLGDPEIEAMVAEAIAWANAVKRGDTPHWLVFLGASGVGKTHIMDRLWRWLETRPGANPPRAAYAPRKVYWPDFVDRLRDGQAYELYADMKRWPFLYLDDVWANRTSDFSEEKLSTLIGCRGGRWTMITANATPQAIAARDVRITSRFGRDGCRMLDVRTKDFNRRAR